MKHSLCVVTLGLALACAAGCKKKDGGSPAAGSGSGTAAMAGSAKEPAGSGADPGSAAAGDGKPAGITDELVALTKKVVDAAQGVVAELTATNGDCEKVAAVLTAATTKLKPDTDALGAMLEKLDEASGTWFGEHMVGDLGKAFAAMDPIVATCKDNAAVIAAAQAYSQSLTGE